MKMLSRFKHHRNHFASSLHSLKQASRTLTLKQISRQEQPYKSREPLKVEIFGHSSSGLKLGFIQSSSACITREARSRFLEVHLSVDGFLVPGIHPAARPADKSAPMKFRSQESPLQPI